MSDAIIQQKTLSELFSLEDKKYTGVFGIMCALSADETYMDKLLESFTGLNRMQREYRAKISLMLLLDPHNNPIVLPGLAWAYPNSAKWNNKTPLLHAKVALLGFGESASGIPSYFRLIVFTGNWTQKAVNNSINLLWYCDYDVKNCESEKQEAFDINEAAKYFEHITEGNYFVIENAFKKLINNCYKNIREIVQPPARGYKTRFIHNLKQESESKKNFFSSNSLARKVIDCIKNDNVRRNFICCGSGFFEEIDEKKNANEPEVLHELIEQLTNNDLFAKNSLEKIDNDGDRINKWLVINPGTSGAAGWWFKQTKKEDLTWLFHNSKYPGDKKHLNLSFHAKYIYLAYEKKNDSFTNGIMYLGSANLSKQGFVLAPETGGNIEAGVVFLTDERLDNDELCERLGIGDVLKKSELPEEIKNENEEIPGDIVLIEPLINSCIYDLKKRTLKWIWQETSTAWDNIKIADKDIPKDQNEMLLENPAYNVILSATDRNGKENIWIIPVFTEQGNFCSPITYIKNVNEIIDTLNDFPPSYTEGKFVEDGGGEWDGPNNEPDDQKNNKELRDEYEKASLHSASLLVETIAEQNQKISEGQMADWVEYLRKILIESVSDETKKSFKELGINFMQPLLKVDGFIPDTPTAEYHALINEVTTDWGLSDALPLNSKGVVK